GRAHRGRDGSAVRGQRGRAHGLRHVQGGRSRHAHHRRPAAPQVRRQVRHLHGGLMLAVEEAHARIVAAFAPLPTEGAQLAAAADRVLARDLIAERDQPPSDTSAMDGYAVRAADLASGSATLRLVGSAPAGGAYDKDLRPGETVRIFTGGPLPRGADAVALQENARAEGDRVHLEGAIEPGTFVRPAGLDFRRGERALPAGRRLGPRDIGLAAALNHAWLPVRRRPRVALLATGDELVLPGQPLGPSQ